MPRTIDGVIAWARANANNMNWSGWCEKFINNAGAFNQAFPSAKLAGDNSGWLNPDWARAPRGAIHYWFGAGGYGHDAFELGDNLLLMASSSVDEDWGNNLGTVTFQRYARLGLPYRGWTMRHGTETLSLGSGTAGGDYDKIPEKPKIPESESPEMLMIHRPKAGVGGQTLYAVFGPNFWLEFVGDVVANGFIRQITSVGSSVEVTESFWDYCKAAADVPAAALTKADVADALQSIAFRAE